MEHRSFPLSQQSNNQCYGKFSLRSPPRQIPLLSAAPRRAHPRPRMRAFKFIKVACRQHVESRASLKGLRSGVPCRWSLDGSRERERARAFNWTRASVSGSIFLRTPICDYFRQKFFPLIFSWIDGIVLCSFIEKIDNLLCRSWDMIFWNLTWGHMEIWCFKHGNRAVNSRLF
jgi:hypothetical protein